MPSHAFDGGTPDSFDALGALTVICERCGYRERQRRWMTCPWPDDEELKQYLRESERYVFRHLCVPKENPD